MTDVVFQREMLPLGEFLKINLDIRVEQVVFDLPRCLHFNWIKTALLAATAMVSLNSFSQDLIARQAPIDRKLKSVDSLALQKQIRAEQSLYPGLDLYPNWNNEFVQAYGNAIVPESYTFDLTGFCMPTPNTGEEELIMVWISRCM